MPRCPYCNNLIGKNEKRCPYCGGIHSDVSGRIQSFVRALGDPAKLVRGVVYLNIGMYLLSLLLNSRPVVISWNPLDALTPDGSSLEALGATGTYPIGRLHRWWTLLSANFLHAGLIHIFFNMLILWQMAPLAGRIFGSYRLIVIYLMSGCCGFLISYLAGVHYTVGASAAICGMIGGLLYYGKNRGGVWGQNLYRQLGGWMLMLLLLGMLFPRINNWGHAGGVVAGAILAALLGYNEKKPQNRLHVMAGTGCAVAALIVLASAVVSGLASRFF